MVKILGIESSCDETAAAVVADGRHVLSSIVASQLDAHAKYGGVVPELASREHLRAIVPVVRDALQTASMTLGDLQAIAVTEGPGLVGALLVGITYAKALSFATGLPLIGVNHVEGHIYGALLDQKVAAESIWPALALVVSGGHTHLFEVTEPGRYRLLGKTRDDAAGEAYDKVAKLLGYRYPGGPILDRLAPFGDPRAVRFSPARMKGNALDFSFSGLKTAVLRWVENHDLAGEIAVRRELAKKAAVSVDEWKAATPQRTLDLIASFQARVIDELMMRSVAAADEIGANSVIVSGGVACNAGLREAAQQRAGYKFLFPSAALSADNAAMIAAAAFPKFAAGKYDGFDLKAQSQLALSA